MFICISSRKASPIPPDGKPLPLLPAVRVPLLAVNSLSPRPPARTGTVLKGGELKKRDVRQETRDKIHETGDVRQET